MCPVHPRAKRTRQIDKFSIGAFLIDRDGPGKISGVAIDDDAWTPALYPADWTEQPAASLPAGLTSQGLPVGLQIIGRHLADRVVVAAAAAFEKVQPFGKWPPISVKALELS